MDGALLRRYGDGGRDDVVRRPRYDAAARAVRCAGYRHACPVGTHAHPRTTVAAGLPLAGVLVRTDVLQTCRQVVRRRTDPCRRRELRSRGVSAVARTGAGFQGAT